MFRCLSPWAIVLPSERDLAVGDIDNAVIGNSDAMGVARQVLQQMLWPTEWRLGVGDPVFAKQGSQEAAKRPFGPDGLKCTRKLKAPAVECVLQTVGELTAKHPC